MPHPLWLRIEGARQNNLKNISLALPHDRVTVITGVSGSGKSSLAFDTLFAEGQWRYIESLSTYARMFLERVDRPDVDRIEQIRPSIAIEQKNPVRTARSTVGTATEIYDYLRLLFAKIGRVHCPQCSAEGGSDTAETVVDTLLREHPAQRALLAFPLAVPPGARTGGAGTTEFLASLLQRGFARVKVGGRVLDLSPPPDVDLSEAREILVVLDRVILAPEQRGRLSDSMEMAFREGGGRVEVEVLGGEPRVFAQQFRCPKCNLTLARPQPLLFSFNHPLGACPDCKGFGNILRYDEARLVPDPSKSLADGAVEPWSHPSGRWYQKELLKAAKRRGLDVSRPYADLTDADKQWLREGERHFSGIRGFFEEVETYRYKLHVRVFLSRNRSQFPCPRCSGARLNPQAAPALRRRGPADHPGQPARLPARGNPLRARRAVHRPPRPRHRAPGRALPGAGLRRQHRRGRRARPDLHGRCRLPGGARPRLGRARRRGRVRGKPRRVPEGRPVADGALPDRPGVDSDAAGPPGGAPPAHPRGGAGTQPQGPHAESSPPRADLRHGRVGLGQVHPGPRHALPRSGAGLQGRVRAARSL